MTVFVDGWVLGEVLGEGAYGEVKLVINTSNNECVAMKTIDLNKHPDAKSTTKKETTIHRMLSNPNIIQYFGQRSEKNVEYIFLEYASGGELFDRIEPDRGMKVENARRYFGQLISAVEYLHSKGVAHRDLKPENLLLDENDNLKVTDFGLATVFRIQGKERYLETKCGTLPYVAPEVLEKPYAAEPADIWSCGIILVALLAGELPWDEASEHCPEYQAWKADNFSSLTPWTKLDNDALSLALIKKILVHSPSRRYKIQEIKEHEWFTDGKKKESNIFIDNHDERDSGYSKICFSQPELPAIGLNNFLNLDSNSRSAISFSQPVHVEDLLLSSQIQFPQTQTTQNSFQKLVKRMTRFFAKTSFEETITSVQKYLDGKGLQNRMNDYGIITASTRDKRKMPLIFKINIINMDNNILVDFRLSKGCGIEFKKVFIEIKKDLKSIEL